ncbi:MAG: 2-dehydropantoate 2-reductase [Gammaproteobacteria bacterium]|nr:2-dehydropantoate 2-reductase [Gammaproteobacteria bacterium]MBP6053017.1 2-dehydropantoate 2-reductase [Pseudomonadales bacterium]MBK6583530.1 2-dehydropantoate 2-reductase [Gammaproteobacteria bacterium]MBK7169527.1 2-dehydropantoate 2-reductase [Gammaproteobacteria bacterium]MBK7521868.1 2-dehydropantoate 2-reductase [Gammaproteobacteria bacterium]
MTANPAPTWHILGSGSMACLWSAYLLASGHTVRMIRREPPPRAEYHELVLETAAAVREFQLTLEARDAGDPLTRLLVCTKAHEVSGALRPLAPRIATDACVVLLQNGIGFQDEAARIAPRAQLYCALTTEGAYLKAPFRVRHAGIGHTLVGGYPAGDLTRTGQLATELRATGLEIRVTTAIDSALWRKLAVNCAINPLSAAHGCSNGALLDEPARHAEFLALCREISAILQGLGRNELALEVEADATAVARATAHNRSSMLQDLDAGKRTEIEYITGFLCRQAHLAGIASPRNDALYARIRALEPA